MKKKPLPPSTQAAAVITGAGSGIGRSFAYEVARRGGSVLCVDIDAAVSYTHLTLPTICSV